MNSSVQAIGSKVQPSFGMMQIEPVCKRLHPTAVLGETNGQKFINTIDALENVTVKIGDDGISIVKHTPGCADVEHSVNTPNILSSYGKTDTGVMIYRNYLRFDDGLYRLNEKFNRDQCKYGYTPLQRIFVAVEEVAKKLNRPMEKFNLHP